LTSSLVFTRRDVVIQLHGLWFVQPDFQWLTQNLLKAFSTSSNRLYVVQLNIRRLDGGGGEKGRLTMQLNWTVTMGPEERCILCVDGKLA